MNNLEAIEKYYKNQLSPSQKEEFEKTLQQDTVLVEELAFYIQAKEAGRREARQQRLAELADLGKQRTLLRSRQLGYVWAAVASLVMMLGVGWYIWTNRQDNSSEIATYEWATQYVENNLTNLNQTLGNSQEDSLQLGIKAYNKGQWAVAQTIWQELLNKDKNNAELEKLLGIVSLKKGDYDQAISYFHRLSTRTDLVSNPGKFYEAIALLKKQAPLDKIKAESLLKEVKTNKLEGWKEME